MNPHQIKRLFGYGLWLLGAFAFLPQVFLAHQGPPDLHEFLLFDCLVICFLGGYLLVDAGNAALQRQAQGQPVDHTDVLGSPERTLKADKHYADGGTMPAILKDRRPDDMRAARTVIGLVLGLLAVCVLLSMLISPPRENKPVHSEAPADTRSNA